ncbi:ABC transporter ATP-binding protein [Sedimentitalea sp. CY04]|uniref:ABC transporter ATP-binding protein n=1 Tax=Parasedimentitalea denitrificans TaxID=2211118 RepID=A0ABX0W3I5_9RHOB|nr:ABC transporter ATP-binding protein [Sedimentitalea sp. CY04]NIZ60206.1 ABC transporter ATP-binding protein [Sedimentitalea sp. CY04]
MLELKNLTKAYGALRVVDDMTLEIAQGETLGIIGPNGAGKTSLFSVIAGQVAADSGEIRFCGQDVTRRPPFERCKAGLGRTFQVPRPFHGMTVFESAHVAASFGAGLSGQAASDFAAQAVERTGLLRHLNEPCSSLTLLDRKRMELTRALATNPKMLLLDEIGGGLTDHEIHELIDILNQIRDSGVSIVWIEHIVHALTSFVDRLIVINFGRKIADGNPKEVMALPEVHEIYMGVDIDDAA